MKRKYYNESWRFRQDYTKLFPNLEPQLAEFLNKWETRIGELHYDLQQEKLHNSRYKNMIKHRLENPDRYKITKVVLLEIIKRLEEES